MMIELIHDNMMFHGGATEVVVNLATELVKAGHTVDVTTSECSERIRETLACAGVSINANPPELADVTHLISGTYHRPATVWTCLEPVYALPYSDQNPLKRFYNIREETRRIKKSNPKIIVADELTSEMITYAYGASANIIPYGVDSKFWQGEKTPHTGSNLVQVGEIQPYKNQMWSLDFLYEICGDQPVTLTLFGRPHEPYYSNLMKTAREIGISDKIIVHEHMSRDVLRKFYLEKADLLLHPVRYQGGWLTPFEAACCGVPVLMQKLAPCYAFYESVPEPKADWIQKNMTWRRYAENILHVYECNEKMYITGATE